MIEFINELLLGDAEEGFNGNGAFLLPKCLYYMGKSGAPSPSWKDVILSGVSPLTLVNAKEDGLNYLKLFGGTENVPQTYLSSVVLEGGTEQSGTPTPTTPLNIVCNNGALKVSPNVIKSTVQSGSANDVNWTVNADKSISITGTASAETDISIVNGLLLKAGEYTISGCSGGDVTTYYFEYQGRIGNQWVIMRSTVGASTVTYSSDVEQAVCRIRINNGQTINTTIYPQIEKGSTPTPYMPYGEIYADGTQEVVTDAVGNTASAEMLLALSTYKDTQDVISGAITRNIETLVLDGSENWGVAQTGTTNIQFRLNNILNDGTGENLGLITHFETIGYASNPDVMQVGVYLQPSYNRLYVNVPLSVSADLTAWQQWLADQYAAGTPVIIVYPLATATTESVSPQVLTTEPITQTAGSISGLGITATESTATVPTPSRPLDIVCNNGVLKYGWLYNFLNSTDYQSDWVNTTDTGTVSYSGAEITYTLTQTPDSNFGLRGSPVFPLTDRSSHKLYITYEIFLSRTSGSGGQWFDNNGRVNPATALQQINWSTANQWQTCKILGTANAGGNAYQGQAYPLVRSSGWTTGDYWKIRNYCVFDLTEICGAGNEPSTLADIEALLLGVYTVGITETIKDSLNNTATAEMLLKVGNYADEQEVLTGDVVRNIGIKVFDGTEAWETLSSHDGFSLILTDAVVGVKNPIVSTHEKQSTTFLQEGMILGGGISNNVLYWTQIYSVIANNLTGFKQWLADQYAAGTPVILVYPLATPTTESVTGQSLTTTSGDNILEITQASMDGLTMEVSYKAAVIVTITEIENANLDSEVNVTIS